MGNVLLNSITSESVVNMDDHEVVSTRDLVLEAADCSEFHQDTLRDLRLLVIYPT
jgi:hypothetical protein